MQAYKARSDTSDCPNLTGLHLRGGILPVVPEQKQVMRVPLVRAFADVLSDTAQYGSMTTTAISICAVCSQMQLDTETQRK